MQPFVELLVASLESLHSEISVTGLPRCLTRVPSHCPYLPTSSPQDGYTPIHKAAWKGHVDVIKVLVAAGVDKDLKSDVSTDQV